MLTPKTDSGRLMNVSLNIITVAVIATAVLQFYVAFYYRGFVRAGVILQAGLFMGVTLALISYVSFKIMQRIPGFLEKRPRIHLIIFPGGVLVAGILAEFLIFKMQGAHYYWLLGGVVLAFFLSLLLDAHENIKYLITDSISLLEKLYRQVILSLNKSLEVKEPYNKGHNERVAWYAVNIARQLGQDDETSHRIARAALLHDLGKIGISEKILLKEGTLNDEDWRSIRHHPGITERILKPLSGFAREIDIIRLHHEHIDGSGYSKLQGEEIPLESRIIAVADAFDAMTTHRPYREEKTPREALKELESHRGTLYEGEIVEALSDFILKQGSFEKPDYMSIRREMAMEAIDTGDEINREDLLEAIKGTARKFTLLEKFYRLMGMKEKYYQRRVFNALASGGLLGMFIGFAIYSTSHDPAQLVSFLLQGIAGGVLVMIPGSMIDRWFVANSKSVFWKSPRGRAIYYFPTGLLAGWGALHIFLHFRPDAFAGWDAWNIAYVIVPGFIAGGVAYGTDFVQKIASVLIFNLRNLEKLYFQLIYSLAFALEAKDPYTRGHSERVALYSMFIGRQMRLASREIEELKLSALFHDVGKIGVRLSVLHKNDRLDEGEFDQIKKHPVAGAEIISSIGTFSRLARYVRHHHEHWAGTGYPDGLSGGDIPLLSRIISVADAFDALVTMRPYKPGMPVEEAIKIIREESGTKFDPEIVELFVNSIDSLDIEGIQEAEAYPDIETGEGGY